MTVITHLQAILLCENIGNSDTIFNLIDYRQYVYTVSLKILPILRVPVLTFPVMTENREDSNEK